MEKNVDNNNPKKRYKPRIVCRVRPILPRERALENAPTVANFSIITDRAVSVKLSEDKPSSVFQFDKIFPPETTQADFFVDVAQSAVHDLWHGVSNTIMAYGQTGTGKTYSIFGLNSNTGLIPLSGQLLLALANERPADNVKITCSFYEIYNEALHDLLAPDPWKKNTKLVIRGLNEGPITIENLTDEVVTTAVELDQLIARGQQQRAIQNTRMSQLSSRSHALVTITLHRENMSPSTLTFVDLAGSERVGRTSASGMRESLYINKSLAALQNCLTALAKKSRHVPLRDSKLTRVLSSSLIGDIKTTIVLTCSPHYSSIEETLATLKFGRSSYISRLGAVLVTMRTILTPMDRGLFAQLPAELVQHIMLFVVEDLLTHRQLVWLITRLDKRELFNDMSLIALWKELIALDVESRDSADLKQQLESERQKRIELEQQLKNLIHQLNENKYGSPPNAKNSTTYSIKDQNDDTLHSRPHMSVDEGDHLAAVYSPIKQRHESHSNSLENSNQGSDLTRSPSPRTDYTLLATPHSITQSPRSHDERDTESGLFIDSMPYLGLSSGQRPRSYSATPSNSSTSNSTNIPITARTDSGGSNSRADSMLNSPVISTMNSIQKNIMNGQNDVSTSTSTEGADLAFDLKQRRELQSLKMKLTRENEHFREHNRQLSTANQRLEHDNTSLKNRILSLERKLHQYEETLIKQQQRLTDNSSKITQLQQDKTEAKKLDRKYTLVCEEKVSLEVELETWKRKYNRLNTDHQRLEMDLQQREYEVAKMTKDLQEKELTLSKMAMKLISLKQKIDSVESVLCKYFVKKLYKVFPSDDAQLSMTRNPSTQVVSLDILVNGKKVSHSLDAIQSVTIYPKSETRFSITYKDGQMDVFESTARDEILRQLQEFRASVRTEQGTG